MMTKIHLSKQKMFSDFMESALSTVQKVINRRISSMSSEFNDLDVKVEPSDDESYLVRITMSDDHMKSWPAGNSQQNGVELKNGIVFSSSEWARLSDQVIASKITNFVHTLKHGNSEI